MRLGTSYGWTEFLGSPHVTEYADAAWRLADRLPPRERSLVGANRLHERGDLAALDSLERFVALYPDDADGWELLGDAQLHSIEVTGRPLASPLAAFDHAIALDSSAAPAYMHPLDLALMLGDSVAFDRHMEGFARIAAPERVSSYRNARALRWGPNTRSAEVIAEALRANVRIRARPRGSASLNAGEGNAFFSPTPRPGIGPGARRLGQRDLRGRKPTLAPRRREGGLLRVPRPDRPRSVRRGRGPGGHDVRLRARSPRSSSSPTWPPGSRRRVRPHGQWPTWTPFRSIGASRTGRPPWPSRATRSPRARALLDSPLASDSSAEPSPSPAYFRALRAWATIAAGDTLGGLAALRAGVRETGYDQRYFLPRLPLLVTLARTQAARPEGRVEGIDRLTTLVRGYLFRAAEPRPSPGPGAGGRREDRRGAGGLSAVRHGVGGCRRVGTAAGGGGAQGIGAAGRRAVR